MKNILLLICLFLGYHSIGQLAKIIDYSHICGEINSWGNINAEILEPAEVIGFEWSNGSTDLNQNNLAPGIYILTVNDIYGCFEEYKVEILDFSSCSLFPVLTPINECKIKVELILKDNSGEIIPAHNWTAYWEDDPLNLSKSRNFYLSTPVDFEVGGILPECCESYIDIYYASDEICPIFGKGKLVVNEVSKNNTSSGQFIELLVLGEGDCNVDLRDYTIDDNDGNLITPSMNIQEGQIKEIGVNLGNIKFANIGQWENISAGSIIVLHDGNDQTLNQQDDPTDSNQDNIYIVNLNASSNLFKSFNTNWNGNEAVVTNIEVNLSFSPIGLTENIDGVQTRKPNNEISHAISYGSSKISSFQENNTYVNGKPNKLYNISQLKDDFHDSASYLLTNDMVNYSPGLPNTPENALLINTELNCGQTFDLDSPQAREKRKSIISYPNPFSNKFTVSIKTDIEGDHLISLKTIDGKEILYQQMKPFKGRIKQDFAEELNSGIYIIQVRFPDGSSLQERVIKIQ